VYSSPVHRAFIWFSSSVFFLYTVFLKSVDAFPLYGFPLVCFPKAVIRFASIRFSSTVFFDDVFYVCAIIRFSIRVFSNLVVDVFPLYGFPN